VASILRLNLSGLDFSSHSQQSQISSLAGMEETGPLVYRIEVARGSASPSRRKLRVEKDVRIQMFDPLTATDYLTKDVPVRAQAFPTQGRLTGPDRTSKRRRSVDVGDEITLLLPLLTFILLR